LIDNFVIKDSSFCGAPRNHISFNAILIKVVTDIFGLCKNEVRDGNYI